MDRSTFESYLKDRYEAQVIWYDEKATKNQSLYTTLQLGLLIFAALTPALVGLDRFSHPSELLGWITLGSSLLVAILSSALKTFKFQENWINYRTTCETLRKEIHFYEGNVDDYATSGNSESLFIERVEAIISRENTLWLKTAKRKVEKST